MTTKSQKLKQFVKLTLSFEVFVTGMFIPVLYLAFSLILSREIGRLIRRSYRNLFQLFSVSICMYEATMSVRVLSRTSIGHLFILSINNSILQVYFMVFRLCESGCFS